MNKTRVLLAAAALAALAFVPTANAVLYVHADSYANCHYHSQNGGLWTALAMFSGRAGGDSTDIGGIWSVTGTSNVMPGDAVAGNWPLELSVSLYKYNGASPALVSPGFVVSSNSIAKASSTLNPTGITQTDPQSDVCS